MRKTKPTVTIGIPAFNEEANIGHLLQDILKQKTANFKLEKILVYSDASTDKTNQIVKEIKSSKIQLIAGKKRAGVGEGTNKLIKNTNSEIFVLLNADIVFFDENFIEKLIQQIVNGEADLTSGNLHPLPAFSLFEKILYVSMSYKRRIFEGYNEGNNLFTCYGQMRGFSKRLYKEITFKRSVGDDMYSFLCCAHKGYKYVYAKNAQAFFKLSSNLRDYRRQSTRYWNTASLYHEFGEGFVDSHYLLPKKLFLKEAVWAFWHFPFQMTVYLLLTSMTKLEAKFAKSSTKNNWAMATSSKVLTKTIPLP